MPTHYTSVLLKCWLCGFHTPPVLNIVIRWLIWVIRHIQGYHHKEETYASNIYKFQPQWTPVRGAIGYVKHPKKPLCYSHPVRTTPLWFATGQVIAVGLCSHLVLHHTLLQLALLRARFESRGACNARLWLATYSALARPSCDREGTSGEWQGEFRGMGFDRINTSLMNKWRLSSLCSYIKVVFECGLVQVIPEKDCLKLSATDLRWDTVWFLV